MCGSIFKAPTTQVNNSICNIICPGNSSQTCGGFIGSTYYVSVYSTFYNKTTYNCKLVIFFFDKSRQLPEDPAFSTRGRMIF